MFMKNAESVYCSSRLFSNNKVIIGKQYSSEDKIIISVDTKLIFHETFFIWSTSIPYLNGPDMSTIL